MKINKTKKDKKFQLKKLFRKKEKKNYVRINLYDDSLYHITTKRVDLFADQILGTRKNQQDAFNISESTFSFFSDVKRSWAVVCDGMGGMSSGEIASGITTDVIKQILVSALPEDSIYEVLRQAVFIANSKVKEISSDKCEMSGTTLVCAVIEDNKLHYLSVGDSRIYIYREDEFLQITRDHNYFLELKQKAENGEISYDEALSDPQKEALISYIGIDELNIIDINNQPIILKNDDVILLCSDGLTKVLDDLEIARIIKENSYDIREIVKVLLNEIQIVKPYGLDNTTIAVMKYSEN